MLTIEADFWRDRWREGRTAWDQPDVHVALGEHWDQQIGRHDGSVFVPLCGKSVDMDWLAGHGHVVIGVDLSEIAVAEFFAERELVPDVRQHGDLTVSVAGPFELWCGDLFDMERSMLEEVVAVYDRASVVALPPEMRRGYADHMTAILPVAAAIFLLTFQYDQQEMDGPPFSVGSEEVAALYANAYEIDVISVTDVLGRNVGLRERGLTDLSETSSVLRRRT